MSDFEMFQWVWAKIIAHPLTQSVVQQLATEPEAMEMLPIVAMIIGGYAISILLIIISNKTNIFILQTIGGWVLLATSVYWLWFVLTLPLRLES